MAKIIYYIALFFASLLGIHAQEFQGMAVYESKTSMEDFKTQMSGNKNITPEMQKTMEDRMKSMFEKHLFSISINRLRFIKKKKSLIHLHKVVAVSV